jgi:hypothetical protein
MTVASTAALPAHALPAYLRRHEGLSCSTGAWPSMRSCGARASGPWPSARGRPRRTSSSRAGLRGRRARHVRRDQRDRWSLASLRAMALGQGHGGQRLGQQAHGGRRDQVPQALVVTHGPGIAICALPDEAGEAVKEAGHDGPARLGVAPPADAGTRPDDQPAGARILGRRMRTSASSSSTSPATSSAIPQSTALVEPGGRRPRAPPASRPSTSSSASTGRRAASSSWPRMRAWRAACRRRCRSAGWGRPTLAVLTGELAESRAGGPAARGPTRRAPCS